MLLCAKVLIVFRGLKQKAKNEPLYHDAGRKPLLSQAGCLQLANDITERSINLQAPNSGIDFHNMFQAAVKSEKSNQLASVEYTGQTLRNYKNKAKLIEVPGQRKNKTRIDAYQNIRTPISFCAMLNATQQQIAQECFFSSDDVSVLLNGMSEKPKVITTPEAIKFLQMHNLSVATEEVDSKQRVVSFNCTISGDWRLICSVIKFADKSFINFNDKPKVFKVEDRLYVCFYRYGLKDEVVNNYIYQSAIIPEVMYRRESLKFVALNHNELSLSQDGVDAVAINPALLMIDNANAVNDDAEKFNNIAMACDGAYGQITAIIDMLHPRSVRKGHNIAWLKYAGGCSLVQSANDKGACHRTLHNLFKSTHFKYEDVTEPLSPQWANIKNILHAHLDSASFSTVWKCFCHARLFLDKAFNGLAIKTAFEKSGVYMSATGKFDAIQVLSQCPHFLTLATDDAKSLIDSLPQFYDIFSNYGYIPEDCFDEILSSDVDNCPKRKGQALNNLAVNRQRCMIISERSFFEHAQMREEDARSNRLNKLWRRNANESGILQSSNVRLANKSDAKVPRQSTQRQCSNIACMERNAVNNKWERCTVKYCRSVSCGKEACNTILREHMAKHQAK